MDAMKKKRGRRMYHLEAALEYLISILVAGSYLATLTKAIGLSDGLTGILSSVISLGCLFQLFSVALRPKRVKRTVVVLSVLNQLLFMLLYVIPQIRISAELKAVIFVVCIIGAYMLYYLAHPKKIAWMMSMVEEGHRGSFTANKEIISLISGMVFSFGMGVIIDRFEAVGNLRGAFILSGIVIFLLMVLHTLSMLLTPEAPGFDRPEKEHRRNLAGFLKNKNLLHVMVVFILYYVSTYVATPFYGTYQIGELGFSLTFVSILTILSSVVRVLVSRAWGRYADRHSFAFMIEKCLLLLAAGYVCTAVAVPSNGRVTFALYFIFHGIAQGGINSALTNMIFDYVPDGERSDSLAVCQAAAGSLGFAATLSVTPLVSFIQQSGNTVVGLPLYAQQVMSGIAFLLVIVAVIYVRLFLLNKNSAKSVK